MANELTAVKVSDKHGPSPYQVTLDTYRASHGAHRTDICEALIDAENLKALLSHLQTVCEDKAEHINANWQDAKLAKQWERAAKLLNACANKLPNDAGIGYGN